MIPGGLQWGYKFVGTDLATDDHNGGRYRYRLGEWHEAENPMVHDSPCPQRPGDGLCVARTLLGAQSGGLGMGAAVMLLVGFTEADVLAETVDKVRVARLWVHPDPVDPLQAIISAGANLSGANLFGANLFGASLSGANLYRADLSRARGDRDTSLPAGWMVSANGFVVQA